MCWSILTFPVTSVLLSSSSARAAGACWVMEAPCGGSTSAVARLWPPICYPLNEVTEASLLVSDETDGEGTECSGEALVIRDQQWSSFGQSCFLIITVWQQGGCSALRHCSSWKVRAVSGPGTARAFFFFFHRSVSL